MNRRGWLAVTATTISAWMWPKIGIPQSQDWEVGEYVKFKHLVDVPFDLCVGDYYSVFDVRRQMWDHYEYQGNNVGRVLTAEDYFDAIQSALSIGYVGPGFIVTRFNHERIS